MNSTNLKNSKLSDPKPNTIKIELPRAGTISTMKPTTAMENAYTPPSGTLPGISTMQQDQFDSASSKKIEELVRKTSEMSGQIKQNDRFVEEKFDNLRKRINNSMAFLRSTKNQIENIKFLYQKDMLNMGNEESFSNSLNLSDESIGELNIQMVEIQEQLNSIRKRSNTVRDNRTYDNEDFESTVLKTVNALDSIGRGDYNKDNSK